MLQDATACSIVLMHDGGGDRTSTVEALPAIIRGLRAEGLEPVTVPQLLADSPPTERALLQSSVETLGSG